MLNVRFLRANEGIIWFGIIGLAFGAACSPASAPTPEAPLPTTVPTAAVAPTAVPPSPTIEPPTLVPATPTPKIQVISPTTAAQLKSVAQVKANFAQDLAWSPDNKTLVALVEGAVVRYDAETLSVSNTLETKFAQEIFDLSVDGKLLVGLAPDSSVKIWAATNGKEIATMPVKGAIIGAQFTPDGTQLATYSADQIEITMWDTTDGKAIKTLSGFQTAAPVYSAVFAPNNKAMAWVSRATVQFMDTDSTTLGPKLQFEDFVGSAQFTPDAKTLALTTAGTVGGKSAGLLEMFDAQNGNRTQQLTTTDFFSGLDISPDGNLVATSSGSSLLLWHPVAGTTPVLITAGASPVRIIKFSHDGAALATSQDDGTIKVWQVSQ